MTNDIKHKNYREIIALYVKIFCIKRWRSWYLCEKEILMYSTHRCAYISMCVVIERKCKHSCIHVGFRLLKRKMRDGGRIIHRRKKSLKVNSLIRWPYYHKMLVFEKWAIPTSTIFQVYVIYKLVGSLGKENHCWKEPRCILWLCVFIWPWNPQKTLFHSVLA